MINALIPIYVDSSFDLDVTGGQIYEGNGMTLNANGKLIKLAANVKCKGLAMVSANQYRNMSYDAGTGQYGSDKISILIVGKVQLYPEIIDLSDGSTLQVNLWDSSVNTAVPGTPLYFDNTGLITTSNSQATTIFGKVELNPTQNNGILVVEVNCL